MTPRFAIGLLPFILGTALALSYLEPADDAPIKPASSAPVVLREPDYKLDAAQWHAEFARDAAVSAEKYKDKIIELSGTVEFVGEDANADVGCVFLKVEGASLGDRCATTDRQPWLKVSPGSKVRLRGRVPDFGLPGDLVSAEIVEAGPNPAVYTSALLLAKEYAADGKAATAKYDDAWANLNGEVIGKAAAPDGTVVVTLKGDGDVTVACCFGQRHPKALEAVKVGTQVKVYGQLSLWKDKEVQVNSPLITAVK
jgi:hypothetical protein